MRSFIPVTIQPFFWVMAVIIGWLSTNRLDGTLIWTIIILISVLFHEYGHALTAVAFGQKARIELMGFGGVTIRDGGRLNKWQEFIVICNGPLAGFLLAAIAWWLGSHLASHPTSLIFYILEVTYSINLFWTIINLLPVQPMDGGKLLGIILEAIFGHKGIKISYLISIAIAALLGVFFMINGSYIAGSLFFLFMYESYNSFKIANAFQVEDGDVSLLVLYKEVEAYITSRTIADPLKDQFAIDRLQTILERAKKGVIYTNSKEMLAKLFSDLDEKEKAFQLLSQDQRQLSPQGRRFLHYLAYSLKRWEDVVAIGDRVYQETPNSQSALTNAMAYAMLNEAKKSVGWLQCAVREGVLDIKQILMKEEFNPIRQDLSFRQYTDALSK